MAKYYHFLFDFILQKIIREIQFLKVAWSMLLI